MITHIVHHGLISMVCQRVNWFWCFSGGRWQVNPPNTSWLFHVWWSHLPPCERHGPCDEHHGRDWLHLSKVYRLILIIFIDKTALSVTLSLNEWTWFSMWWTSWKRLIENNFPTYSLTPPHPDRYSFLFIHTPLFILLIVKCTFQTKGGKQG